MSDLAMTEHSPLKAKLELLCIGEAMAELRRDETGGFDVSFAGDCFNTAIYAARLFGTPDTVGFASLIGHDPLSSGLLVLASDEGLNTDCLMRHSAHNIGIYAVATDDAGERSFHYWRNQSAARHLGDDASLLSALPEANIIYLSAITMAIMSDEGRNAIISFLRSRQKQGSLIAFDSNFRPQLWESIETARAINSDMWQIADIALPSLDDEQALWDQTAEQVIGRFAAKHWHACAIKQAENGPFSFELEQTIGYPKAPKVIDTTAAGDSFNAGYLHALLAGKPEAERLMAGHSLALQVVGVRGALMPR